MDRNTITGFVLIFAVVLAFQWWKAPSVEEIQEQQRYADSLRVANRIADSLELIALSDPTVITTPTQPTAAVPDSLADLRNQVTYGAFAPAARGEDGLVYLENDVMSITFAKKGGRITSVELKDYQVLVADSLFNDVKVPLYLLNDIKNQFAYYLPVAGAAGGQVSTGDLYFDAEQQGNSVVFRADAGQGRYFEQRYTLTAQDGYNLDYDIAFEGLDKGVFPLGTNEIQLHWVNHLNKLEKNVDYERTYSTVYFKYADDDVDYCSCRSDDVEDTDGEPVKWVAPTNQFFTSALIADNSFGRARLETKVPEETSSDLKTIISDIYLPVADQQRFGMSLYIGPNDFDRLAAYDLDLTEVIPYGTSILGTVNRWIIRPLFNFLLMIFGGEGITIIALTLLIKLALYPLTYKMLHSQSKMAALKPQIAKVKAKHPDDAQAAQMETMKMYREFGVNPLGGCLPIAMQMPIWIALYRFFPANIDFRQAEFLWADDLSSYDVIAQLPFSLPFGYGDHVSLFTILWALATVIYSVYNTKHLDMNAQMNPMMKYMQYFMPVMFLFFFNSYAAGLTCYLFFSSLVNIAQTVITKNYIIDKDKILKDLEAYKKKPKKKGGFGARLEEAMKQQQALQAEKKEGGSKRKPRR